jgi:hypothetical protein
MCITFSSDEEIRVSSWNISVRSKSVQHNICMDCPVLVLLTNTELEDWFHVLYCVDNSCTQGVPVC